MAAAILLWSEILVRPRSFASWQSGAGIPTNQTIPFLPVNEGF